MAHLWVATSIKTAEGEKMEKSQRKVLAATSFAKIKERLTNRVKHGKAPVALYEVQRVDIGRPNSEKLCALVERRNCVEEVFETKLIVVDINGELTFRRGG